MSLTGLLRQRDNPVRLWFEMRFPATRTFSTTANRELRGGASSVQPCPLNPPAHSDPSLVGTTIDYLLRAWLSPESLDCTMATQGAAMLSGALRHDRINPVVVERDAVRRISALDPSQLDSSDERWDELCRLLVILARFEQYARAGAVVAPHIVDPLREHAGDLDWLARRLAGPATLDDIRTLSRAAVEDCASLRSATTLHIGPCFAQSRALGGADADIISDGVLLDFKATTPSSVVGRQALWQLVGYLLADTDDSYRIRHVGMAALRWRRRIVWNVPSLLENLSNGHAPSVEELRAEFRDLVIPLEQLHTQNRSERVRERSRPSLLERLSSHLWRGA
jgi:hypothetical protein